MPACNSFQFHMENLHYLSENADYQKQLRKQLHLNDDIAMHSAIIHLAENANIIQEETSTYPWTAFLSDTGGALGKNLVINSKLYSVRSISGSEHTQHLTVHFFNPAQVSLIYNDSS